MIELLQNLNIDLRGKSTGQITTTCPKCSHERKKIKDPCLSVNIDSGVYQCHHCGWHGKVFEKAEKVYSTPIVKATTKLSEKAEKYLIDQRGLSVNTILRFGLYSENRSIAFPFFDQNGKTVHIKYRTADKKFYSSKGTKPILFGMHLEHKKDRLIITEGELDAMSFYEAGHAAVSVPNGASATTWLDHVHEWISKFEEIVIAFDNDEAGIKGRNEISRRIGIHKCRIFRFPDDIKDANQLLVGCKNHGDKWKDFFNKYFQFIEPFPLQGVISVNDLWAKLLDLHKSGYPKGATTGYQSLDELITWAPGQLTIVTGIPSHGKSEFIDQIMIKLSHIKWLIFSPENVPTESHLSKILEKLIGKYFFKMNSDELEEARLLLEDRFQFVDLENIKSIDDIILKTKEAVLMNGINGLLIDPYSRVEHEYVKSGMNETQYVREILDKLSMLSRTSSMHIILVAHPIKMIKDKQGVFEVPNLYSISGSAHFFNTADNGITIFRRPREGMQDLTEIHVQKIRSKWYGKVGIAEFEWNSETGRYSEADPIMSKL